MNEKLFEKIKDRIHNRHGAHDLSHFIRVRDTALKLAEAENADKEIVEAMALLHDLVRHEDWREEHNVEETLKEAESILNELNYAKENIRIILDGIASHSLHSKLKKEPGTVEAKILFDADKIDSVGEVGVARWFMTMGNKNIPVKDAALLYLKTIKAQREKMGDKLYTSLGNELIQEGLAFSINFFNNLVKKLD